MKPRASLSRLFAVPLVIALFSLCGLTSALTGDGWRDTLSWIGLAAPVLAVAWAFCARRS